MSTLTRCDDPKCDEDDDSLVVAGDDQVVVTVTKTTGYRGPGRGVVDRATVLHFHAPCWARQGPVMPLPGTAIRIQRVSPPPPPAPVPAVAPLAPVLPLTERLTAP